MQTHPARRIRREASRQRHRSAKPPKTKYKASEKHVACPRAGGQDERVEAAQKHGPWCRGMAFGGNICHFKTGTIWLDQKLLPKQSSSSAYEQASTGHKTKQSLLGKKVHFDISAVKCLGRGREMLAWAGRFGSPLKGHLKEPPLFDQLNAWSP